MSSVRFGFSTHVDFLTASNVTAAHLNPWAGSSGIYVYGLFCEAGRWNKESKELDESEPKALFGVKPCTLNLKP